MRFGQIERALLATLVIALAGAAAADSVAVEQGCVPGPERPHRLQRPERLAMLVNPDGSGVVRIARTYAADYSLGTSFSRDGTQIAYSTNRGGDGDVFVIRPDGSGQRQITFSRGEDLDPFFSARRRQDHLRDEPQRQLRHLLRRC